VEMEERIAFSDNSMHVKLQYKKPVSPRHQALLGMPLIVGKKNEKWNQY